MKFDILASQGVKESVQYEFGAHGKRKAAYMNFGVISVQLLFKVRG